MLRERTLVREVLVQNRARPLGRLPRARALRVAPVALPSRADVAAGARHRPRAEQHAAVLEADEADGAAHALGELGLEVCNRHAPGGDRRTSLRVAISHLQLDRREQRVAPHLRTAQRGGERVARTTRRLILLRVDVEQGLLGDLCMPCACGVHATCRAHQCTSIQINTDQRTSMHIMYTL